MSAPRAGFCEASFYPLILFLVFTPFYDSIGVPINYIVITLMDWQRLSEMLVVSLVLTLLCLFAWRLHPAYLQLPAIQVWGWLTFFVLGACSSALAAYPRFAWVEWSWLLICFLAAMLLSFQVGRNLGSITVIARLFVLSVLASYTPLYYIRNSEAIYEVSSVITPAFIGFNNPRSFSDFQTAVLCMLPWALSEFSRSSYVRAAAWSLAGCYAALALAAGSRSLILGQVVACSGIFLMLGRKSATVYVRGQLRLWLFAVPLYGLLFLLIPAVLAEGGAQAALLQLQLRSQPIYAVSDRLVLWNSALQMAVANPWLGVGPMHFSAIPNRIAAGPHNQVFQVMAEFGFIAAVLFVFLLGHWLMLVRRGMCAMLPNVTGDQRLFSVSALAALLALLAQSCVSGVFNNPHSQVLLILFAGMLGTHAIDAADRIIVPVRRAALVLAATAALGIFAASCLPWALRIAERNACYFDFPGRPFQYFPRFWQQGWIGTTCESSL